ncbi:MAG TPA: acetoin utilization protein AcuC [Trueperaceae bacterium]|nr:acetoin utilization protein AcuC [Trueperaceae bacterium]
MTGGRREAGAEPGQHGRVGQAPADVRFVYDPALADYELSPEHPFRPERLELTRTLLEACGVLAEDAYAGVGHLTERELARVHSTAYIDAVKRASQGDGLEEAYAFGLGTGDNPVFARMHEAVLRVCAATVTAVELVATGRARRAASFAGGLHHAQRAKASGFCVYNDLALGIRRAVDEHDMRVAYVDLDVHHGDGVQWLFYDSPSVMTVSLHESGRYLFPGTGHTYETGRGAGRGHAVNMPLEPFTEDASFLEAFDIVVPAALRAFQPDLIVLQAGADMHRNDPLADLSLSLAGMGAAYRRVVGLSETLTGGRLVATGGGGYDPFRTAPRAWALVWAAMTGTELPEAVPEAWRRRWAGVSPVALPERMVDDPSSWEPVPRRDTISSHNRVVAERLMEVLETIWNGSGPAVPDDRAENGEGPT